MNKPLFSWYAIFYIKELLVDKLLLSRLGYLADSVLKIDELNLSRQWTQLVVFVANNNIWAFKWKLEFWKLVSNTQNLFLKRFKIKSAKIAMNVIF